MANDLELWQTMQFASNVELLLQQKQSKIMPYVTVKSGYKGKQISPVDQIGSITMDRVVSRFGAKVNSSIPTARRWVAPLFYDKSVPIDKTDDLKQIHELTSPYAAVMAAAINRCYDDTIIDALFASAMTGEQGATAVLFATDTTNTIAVNFGSASNVGLTVAKLREAKRLLMSKEVDLESEQITVLVTAKQHDNLLAEQQVISLDYNERPVMTEGKITRILGMNIVHSERLATDTNTYRRVPVIVKSGMHLAIWLDKAIKIQQRFDLQLDPWEVYGYVGCGATRLEEGKVLEIKCAE